jgi:hypothetical protein
MYNINIKTGKHCRSFIKVFEIILLKALCALFPYQWISAGDAADCPQRQATHSGGITYLISPKIKSVF